jgi:hypothetical protein
MVSTDRCRESDHPSFGLFNLVVEAGRLVAFVALAEGTTQGGVIHPESGDWTILTHDRSHGLQCRVVSGQHAHLLRPHRWFSRGVFSVPALGGSERRKSARYVGHYEEMRVL